MKFTVGKKDELKGIYTVLYGHCKISFLYRSPLVILEWKKGTIFGTLPLASLEDFQLVDRDFAHFE